MSANRLMAFLTRSSNSALRTQSCEYQSPDALRIADAQRDVLPGCV
jgi:hypothetical protein